MADFCGKSPFNLQCCLGLPATAEVLNALWGFPPPGDVCGSQQLSDTRKSLIYYALFWQIAAKF